MTDRVVRKAAEDRLRGPPELQPAALAAVPVELVPERVAAALALEPVARVLQPVAPVLQPAAREPSWARVVRVPRKPAGAAPRALAE